MNIGNIQWKMADIQSCTLHDFIYTNFKEETQKVVFRWLGEPTNEWHVWVLPWTLDLGRGRNVALGSPWEACKAYLIHQAPRRPYIWGHACAVHGLTLASWGPTHATRLGQNTFKHLLGRLGRDTFCTRVQVGKEGVEDSRNIEDYITDGMNRVPY